MDKSITDHYICTTTLLQVWFIVVIEIYFLKLHKYNKNISKFLAHDSDFPAF